MMDIIKAAKKAGIVVKNGELFLEARPFDALQIFEQLIRNDEREACAKLCDDWSEAAGVHLAAEIRARGEK